MSETGRELRSDSRDTLRVVQEARLGLRGHQLGRPTWFE